jgi:RNA polymerase sigma-70 factor (ECF subfamily)
MSSPPQPNESAEATEAYLQLLNAVDRGLNVYIHSLVASNTDAQDLLQEVRITMWKHFGSFVPGGNPLAWARKIALHQILNYRRSQRKRSALSMDREFIEVVAQEIDRQSSSLNSRTEHLRDCLRKLPDSHRKLILWRYFEECGVEEIARKTERSVEAVYRLVSRIRVVLQECVERQQAKPRNA